MMKWLLLIALISITLISGCAEKIVPVSINTPATTQLTPLKVTLPTPSKESTVIGIFSGQMQTSGFGITVKEIKSENDGIIIIVNLTNSSGQAI